MSYRSLDPRLIIETAERLEARIADRFPETGLRKVGKELVSLARDMRDAAVDLQRPIRWLRILVGVVIVLGACVLLTVGAYLRFDRLTGSGDVIESMQGIEAALNTVILVTVGVLALVHTEDRIKRRRVLRQLHGLRSLIHVIDMHQLTKDPAALSSGFKPAAHSPKRTMSRADLLRYLDYCSEMLSITGKLAALFAQSVNDEVVVAAVNDVENLGSNLSRKIWQKITMLDAENGTAS
ncbi:hypothetical protein RB623_19270 [Mesorhizobium sp. LHD-90]|uniref:hypothetical protein n=1 Tax=Mesorhizobium sp. LHD-90 TaxID=3071414 RepID=UPI0027DEE89F|nr:hypothetical protein [Mesorhizobium sp. LHD-90]MDQ6436205.1 hypothetical protein [Mesorhizobium sp. LHD-90]